MFMLKYFRGYQRPTKINLFEYLTHELFSHENFPIYGIIMRTYIIIFKNVAMYIVKIVFYVLIIV